MIEGNDSWSGLSQMKMASNYRVNCSGLGFLGNYAAGGISSLDESYCYHYAVTAVASTVMNLHLDISFLSGLQLVGVVKKL